MNAPVQPSRYLDGLISFGGEPHTRVEVIAQMRAEGTSEPWIDRCLDLS